MSEQQLPPKLEQFIEESSEMMCVYDENHHSGMGDMIEAISREKLESFLSAYLAQLETKIERLKGGREWIPTTDTTLPEEGQLVWYVFASSGKVFIGRYEGYLFISKCGGFCHYSDVSCWQPCYPPKAPNKGEGEQL